MSDSPKIAFHGAARTVTGSRHLIQSGGRRWLFDCGIYQGHRDEADRVNRTFRFAPAEIDAVVLSHAHLDHIGNVPTLVNQGYGGPIHATDATVDLSHIMLEDSAFLMEQDVERVNRHHRGGPQRKPLYTHADVESVLSRLEGHPYRKPWTLFPGVEVDYRDAGHILGSAVTLFDIEQNGRKVRLCMGGDLGRYGRPILRDPEVLSGVDVLVLESTYGDRLHPGEAETMRILVDTIKRTVERGGRVIMPAFAVGRTQDVVATLHRLTETGDVPELPIYVDSPMARATTGVFKRHPECFDEPTRRLFEQGDGEPFGFGRLRYVGSADESRALNDVREPCIIISASGMCEGGRILHHLRHGLGNPRNTVLFVGFQAQGTLGRRLREGAETVNVFGEPVRVNAEMVALDGFSAHADQRELISWVGAMRPKPKRVFLVHGEPTPAETLAALLEKELGVEAFVPELGQEFDLWA